MCLVEKVEEDINYYTKHYWIIWLAPVLNEQMKGEYANLPLKFIITILLSPSPSPGVPYSGVDYSLPYNYIIVEFKANLARCVSSSTLSLMGMCNPFLGRYTEPTLFMHVPGRLGMFVDLAGS